MASQSGVSDPSRIQDVGKEEMDGVGDGGPIFQPIEINAAEAVQRVDFLLRQTDGDHELAIALAAAIAALPGGVG
jgi:hypothetical protein